MKKPNIYSYWVIPGKLLAGEYPDDLKGFIDFGINCFIDLTGNRFPSYKDLFKRLEYNALELRISVEILYFHSKK